MGSAATKYPGRRRAAEVDETAANSVPRRVAIRATCYGRSVADAPKPHLARFFEAVACVMELDRGQHRLELVFEDGRLRQFYARAKKRSPNDLAAFDERAAWLVTRDRTA
jgi:hypothetical protein